MISNDFPQLKIGESSPIYINVSPANSEQRNLCVNIPL